MIFCIINGRNENKPIGITFIARNNKINKHIHVYINQYDYFFTNHNNIIQKFVGNRVRLFSVSSFKHMYKDKLRGRRWVF
jgi:hypothetical protein